MSFLKFLVAVVHWPSGGSELLKRGQRMRIKTSDSEVRGLEEKKDMNTRE